MIYFLIYPISSLASDTTLGTKKKLAPFRLGSLEQSKLGGTSAQQAMSIHGRYPITRCAYVAFTFSMDWSTSYPLVDSVFLEVLHCKIGKKFSPKAFLGNSSLHPSSLRCYSHSYVAFREGNIFNSDKASQFVVLWQNYHHIHILNCSGRGCGETCELVCSGCLGCLFQLL